MRMATLIVEMIAHTRSIIIISSISNIPRNCNHGTIRVSPFRIKRPLQIIFIMLER